MKEFLTSELDLTSIVVQEHTFEKNKTKLIIINKKKK